MGDGHKKSSETLNSQSRGEGGDVPQTDST